MNLYEALAAAHADMVNPKFDSKNPHFGSDYASLETVLATILPVYRKHNILMTQVPIVDGNTAGVETTYRLVGSDEKISFQLLIPLERPSAHAVGSSITYARRYGPLAFAGLVGEADDDGNAAVAPPVKAPAPAQSAAQKAYSGPLGWFWNELNDHKARLGPAFYPIVDAGTAPGKMTTEVQRKSLLAKLAEAK